MSEPVPDSLMYAQSLSTEGDHAGALSTLESAPQPTLVQWWELVARTNLRLQRHHETARAIREANSLGLDSASLRALLAEALLSAGDRGQAELLASSEAHPEATLLVGRMAYQGGRYWEAEMVADRLLQAHPLWLDAQALKFAARASLNDSEARQSLHRLWNNHRSDAAFEYLLFDAELRNAYHEVAGVVRSGRASMIADVGLYSRLAHFYFTSGRREEALRFLDEAPDSIRHEPGLSLIRGQILMLSGRCDQALPLLEAAFAAEPSGLLQARRLVQCLLRTRGWNRVPEVISRHIKASKAVGALKCTKKL